MKALCERVEGEFDDEEESVRVHMYDALYESACANPVDGAAGREDE